MKKENNFVKRFSSGKALWISAAAVILAVIAGSAATNYTAKRLNELAPDGQSFTSAPFAEETEADAPFMQDETVPDITREDQPEATEKAVGFDEKTEPAEQSEPTSAVQNVSSSFIFPIEADVTKRFSAETPVYSKTMGDWRIHTGVDFAAEEGDPVVAVGNGTVTRVASDPMLGYIIEVDCVKFTARYCGVKQGTGVGIGDEVSSGDVIGEVGEIPAEAADGLHLHFEVLKDGKPIDPALAIG